MAENPIKILLIDDDEDDFILTKDLLTSYENTAFSIDWASNYREGENALKQNLYDIYLIDYRLGSHSGLELLETATRLGIKAPIIVLTGKGDRSIDIEAMRLGAADYLVKGEIDARTIERSIRYSVEKSRNTNILYEQELKYRTLFEKSIDAIYITTREQLFIDINHSFLELFKFSNATEVMRQSVKDLFVDESDFIKYNKQLTKNGFVKDLEAALRIKNGEAVNCVISAVELKSVDNIVRGFQGIIRDVSKQKKTEEELRRAEKLAITGKLARTIAHEVRNPLTNIALSMDQLSNEKPGDELVDFYVKIAGRNLQRINNLITELLNSAKPSELNLERDDINFVVEQTLELTKDRIQLQNVKVVKEYSRNVPMFPIDKEKMQVALLNIIINAIEAMEQDKGVLHVKTGYTNSTCVVSISDNGCGINADSLNQLFDAFYTTGKKNGMGLGLTTTQNIVQSHHGTIEVYSEPGKGTEFRILFEVEKQLNESYI